MNYSHYRIHGSGVAEYQHQLKLDLLFHPFIHTLCIPTRRDISRDSSPWRLPANIGEPRVATAIDGPSFGIHPSSSYLYTIFLLHKHCTDYILKLNPPFEALFPFVKPVQLHNEYAVSIFAVSHSSAPPMLELTKLNERVSDIFNNPSSRCNMGIRGIRTNGYVK